jgi:ATP-dependent DNA ligase
VDILVDPDLRAYNAKEIKGCQVADLPDDPSRFCLQPKYNGFRLVSHIDKSGVHTWTRSLKCQDGKIPYVDEELARVFPPGTVVDGEIVALQIFADPLDEEKIKIVDDFEHVQSVMLSKPDKAVAKAAAVRPLDYVVFDIVYCQGQDMRGAPYAMRRSLLESLMAPPALTQPLRRVSLSPQFPAEQHIHDGMVEVGWEGTIAKHLDMPYRSGERGCKKSEGGLGQFKLKTQTELDFVLVDIKPGREGSEFDGLVGALIFGSPFAHTPVSVMDHIHGLKPSKRPPMHEVNGIRYIERGACSGFTLAERHEYTKLWKERPDELIGRVMSAKHMGVYPDGVTFRHPQFGRWRPDKPVRDVIWET